MDNRDAIVNRFTYFPNNLCRLIGTIGEHEHKDFTLINRINDRPRPGLTSGNIPGCDPAPDTEAFQTLRQRPSCLRIRRGMTDEYYNSCPVHSEDSQIQPYDQAEDVARLAAISSSAWFGFFTSSLCHSFHPAGTQGLLIPNGCVPFSK